MLKSDLIDLEAAQQALLIDKYTILELVQQFLYDEDHYIAPLKSALSQRDWNNLKAYAHRLKGAANNLRIHGLGEPAYYLERAAETKQSDSCLEQIRVIEERFSSIREIVEQE